MQKTLRIAATLVVLVGGMALGSARPAHAENGCVFYDNIFDPCGWCGDRQGCTIYGCEANETALTCSCKYDC